jgi:hypothetical protein
MADDLKPPGRPAFIDNRDGNTLTAALGALLGPAPRRLEGESWPDGPIDELCVTTAFFHPAGFGQVRELLEAIPKVRLLIGAELPPEAAFAPRAPGDPGEPAFTRARVVRRLREIETGIRRERDRAVPFTYAATRDLRHLIALLRSGRVEVRSYDRAFLHAKAYIFGGTAPGFVAGSSNFTRAGLASNLELNLGAYDPDLLARAKAWFEDLWRDGVPLDLAEIIEQPPTEYTPYEIFLRVLLKLYGDEVEEEAKADRNVPLTSFQQHGVVRALRIMERCGGAIVADEVGLGKTHIAGAIIERALEERQRVLLLCPATVRDNTWKRFLVRYDLRNADMLSYEELALDRQLFEHEERPHSRSENLNHDLDDYSLVVVDEAHNYRNPGAPTRAAALRRVLFGRPKKVLLLTATPVNNSLWDLFHLIGFYVRQDGFLADRGILSIRGRFEEAMRIDPTALSPDLLYPIIDATTVKRTRGFVKRFYEGDSIVGPDGRPQKIVFPKPIPVTVRYDLDGAVPGLFDRVEEALDPEGGSERLRFARYRLAYYAKDYDEEEVARAAATEGLLRSGLLKRFESSAHAFARTAEKMAREHGLFLKALAEGKVITTEFLQELSGDDSDETFEDLLRDSSMSLPAEQFKVADLSMDVARDRDILEALAHEARRVTGTNDPKLAALETALVEIARQAAADGIGALDARELRKVLIFSFFADTAEWVKSHLDGMVQRHPELKPYEGRLASVIGGDEGDVTKRDAVLHFAPKSSGADPVPEDRLDLLVTTDVLAEGVNLQQARHIINYDMPWNPMRLVQRHGRIDRIGSRHPRVWLRTIFPDAQLDRLLELEQRILNKLAQAAASVGVVAPIRGARDGQQVFTETREEIEKLLREDPSLFERGGSAGAAQTGEEYRLELRKALATCRERVVAMPWKAGSGMVRGTERGVFFCAEVGGRTFLRFVRADARWNPVARPRDGGSAGDEATQVALPYDAEASAGTAARDLGAFSIVSELGTCLRLIECREDQERVLDGELAERKVYDLWALAQADIFASWMRETDPANLQPKVRPLNRRVAAFIRANTPTVAKPEDLDRALDVLESPWPRREEALLRGWFEAESDAGASKSARLVTEILATGLRGVVPPVPLPPITPDQVLLVCWMAVDVDQSPRQPRRT